MPNDMGTFRVDIELENPAKPGIKRTLSAVLVDTGAELSWVPAEVLESLGVERNNLWRFPPANGTGLERRTRTVVNPLAGERAGGAVGLRPTRGPFPPAFPPLPRPQHP